MEALARLEQWLEAYGALGLFLAAGLDSYLPLSHVVDPTVVYLAYTNRDPFTYTLIASAGSVLGTLLLFLLVRKGGAAFVERRLGEDRCRRLTAVLDRYGLLAIFVGGVMPPPFPLKGLVLVAGLARLRVATFAIGLALARLFRYGLESVLAVVYGEQALLVMKEHYTAVGLIAVGLTIASFLVARRILKSTEPATAE